MRRCRLISTTNNDFLVWISKSICTPSPVFERRAYLASADRLATENARKCLVKLPEEQAVSRKAHSPHVFLDRILRMNLQKVFWNASRDGQKVNPLIDRQMSSEGT